MIEVKVDESKIESNCPDFRIDYSIKSHELPHIIALAIIAITMGALLLGKLSQQLDWDIYKKIGGDIEVRSKLLMLVNSKLIYLLMNLDFFFFLLKKKIERYKTILIFEMLLKIDIFFVILYIAITAPLLLYGLISTYDQYTTSTKVLIFVSLSILVLVIFFQALAYKSVKMIIYCTLYYVLLN